jgi:hypothetical protein
MDEEEPESIAEDYRKQQGKGEDRIPRELRTPKQDAVFKLQTALNLFPLEDKAKSTIIEQLKDVERIGAMNMKALAGAYIVKSRFADPLEAVSQPELFQDVLFTLAKGTEKNNESQSQEVDSKTLTLMRAYQAEIYRYLKYLLEE